VSQEAAPGLAVAFREEWGRVVATLIASTGDWDLAEECAQEAFAQAAVSWPKDGVPARPGAWLTTVARNRAMDRLRRRANEGQKVREAHMLRPPRPGSSDSPDSPEDDADESGIADDRLKLIFTCCHPALALEARVALTLRTLAGLTTAEIAKAFLVNEATMAKRLVRAKHKITNAGIPYRVPPAHLLPARVNGVLAVLYLLFNEGYSASNGELTRESLCAEALSLARLLARLMPEEPEAAGLLALMHFQHSRRVARVDGEGNLVTLEHQDRSRWDRDEIAEASEVLRAVLAQGQPGPYQLQAAIAAAHANAPDAGSTPWPRVRALYDQLAQAVPSPVVALNRAVAVAMVQGPEAGLALVEDLSREGGLDGYYLLPATRADFLRRLGRSAEAVVAYREALALAPSEAERRFLAGRIDELS